MLGFSALGEYALGEAPATTPGYVRPHPSAANFAFDGVAYTRPAASAANFTFLSGQQASSLGPTARFGTPTNKLTLQTTGAAPSTQFGTPAAAVAQTQGATGFLTGASGTPTARLVQPVSGFTSTLFGTPVASNNAVGFTSTAFGTPTGSVAGVVVLLLDCEGADGATSITDASPANTVVTLGAGATVETDQAQFGASSVFVVGGLFTGAQITTPVSTDFTVGAHPLYTVEFSFRLSDWDGDYSYVSLWTAWELGLDFQRDGSDSNLHFWGSGDETITTLAIALNEWHSLAYVRNGTGAGCHKWFMDGVLVMSVDDIHTLTATPRQTSFGSDVFGMRGYFDNIRVTKDEARYTANYTPEGDFAAGPVSIAVASSLNPTANFGTPIVPDTGVIEEATGFSDTTFGTPSAGMRRAASGWLNDTYFGLPSLKPHAVGFTSTQFGAVVALYNQTQIASGFLTGTFSVPSTPLSTTGWNTTTFGTVTALNRNRASTTPRTTAFGTPSTPTNRTLTATGFASTLFGWPTTINYAPPLTARNVRVTHFRSIVFGTPVAAPAIISQATALSTTAFGTPASSTSDRCVASAIEPTAVFGTATARERVGATGTRTTGFGTPTHRRTQGTTGFCRTRFGTPTMPRGLQHYGWNTCKFGHPTGFSRFNYRTTGSVSTALGTPSALETHRVTSLKPGTRLGKPLLTRTPIC